MDPEILLYVNKAQLCDDEARLLFNPPCQLYLQITGFISPNPNNVNSIDIPKSQNAFLLYRKNYAAKRKSLGCRKNWKIISKEAGDAWKKESGKVTSYFNILARLALEKHKSIYEKEFQRFLQDEQTDTPSNGADFWRLAGVFCHKMNSKLGQLICIQDLMLTS
nr:3625_t:CDS:2 [Entrophospora candida]